MNGNNTDKNSGLLEVLYEDNHIIAINKKPSQIVQVDKTGDISLEILVKRYIAEKYNKPGEAFLGVIHRIDRPVSGVVVFARTSKALTRLNEMVKSREIQKTYWAIVKNKPKQTEGRLENYLVRNEAKNKTTITGKGNPHAQQALLDYKLISQSDNYYLLEIQLITGRHHQIRAQLAGMGCPIKGDLKYGSERSNPDASICLHARSVTFVHPVKNEEITIVAQPPQDSLWQYFSKQLI